MVFDQPGDGLGLRVAEAEAGTERARDIHAGDRMIFDASLGDIVQEQGDDERGSIVDRQQDLAGEGIFARKTLLLDIDEVADGAQQMFVDRVVVVHVELHQRDDLAEIRHEAAKHAGLVHQAQHDLGRVARGQNVEKQAVGFRVRAQFRVDALQRFRDEAHRVGMDREPIAVGDPKELDEIDRIVVENLRPGDGHAAAFDGEIAGGDGCRRRQEGATKRSSIAWGFAWLLLQGGANDRGQVADFLGDEKIMLHEALDAGEAAARRIAELNGDLALKIEASLSSAALS